MRAGRTVLLVAGLLMAAVVGCTDEPEEPVAAPTPVPTPEETATPEPEPEPEPGAPFELSVADPHLLDANHDVILGRGARELDDSTARQAADDAVQVLQAYLDSQYTDPETWFSEAPLEPFLSPETRAAADDEAVRGLGVLDLDVIGVETGPADVNPVVTMDGDRPLHVTLTYRVAFEAHARDGDHIPLVQHGHAVFGPTEDGWRVIALDVTLEEQT